MRKVCFVLFLLIPLLLSATIYDVSIYDIQYVSPSATSDSSSYAGDTIRTYGVVTGVFDRGHFIQDGYGAWNGVFVYLWGSDTIYSVGDSIEIVGTVSEYYGLTEISPISETVLKTDASLPDPLEITVGDMAAESLEGVYVKLDTVVVSDDSLGYGEWEITENGDYGRVDDMGNYSYNPTNGDTIEVLRGIMHYTYGARKLEPRDDNDIYLDLLKYLGVYRSPYSPGAYDPVTISAKVLTYFGMDTTYLYYHVNNGSWVISALDSFDGTYYYYTIPGQTEGDSVEYYVYFRDNNGDTILSYLKGYKIAVPTSATGRILFDYTKNETAGNADWIIDRYDYPHPSPTTPASETDWDGAISSWGFELDTIGYEVWTLPPDSTIKYEQDGDSLDLSMFDVFIVCEPQNPFSDDEKTAIFDYVRNGGSLFMVADHNSSDRDGDGWDSPHIWNDLGAADSFGMYFNVTGDANNSISDTAASIDSTDICGDTIANGLFGTAAGGVFCYHLGTTMIDPVGGNTSYIVCPVPGDPDYSMLSVATFGNGKVAGMGDSSPADDGTGDPNDDLYDGWNEGVARIVILNTTYWLAQKSTTTSISGNDISVFDIVPCTDGVSVKIEGVFSGYKYLRLLKREGYYGSYELITTFTGNEFEYNDNNINSDVVYYKLEGVAESGGIDLIAIKKYYMNDTRYIGYIPMAKAGDDINVYLTNSIDEDISYRITDISGRVIMSGVWKVGTSPYIKGVLPAGKYTLHINTSRHKESSPFLVVK